MSDLDIDQLHYLASNPRAHLYRCVGKTTYNLVCLLQSLELVDTTEAYYMCHNIRNVGNCLGRLLELCKALDYKVLEVTSTSVKLETGTVKFITDTKQLIGVRPDIVMEDII